MIQESSVRNCRSCNVPPISNTTKWKKHLFRALCPIWKTFVFSVKLANELNLMEQFLQETTLLHWSVVNTKGSGTLWNCNRSLYCRLLWINKNWTLFGNQRLPNVYSRKEQLVFNPPQCVSFWKLVHEVIWILGLAIWGY